MTNRNKAVRDWSFAALCGLAIFISIPLARNIQKIVAVRWGRSFFGWLVIISIGAAFLALAALLLFRLKNRPVSSYVWLALIAAAYLYFTLKLWRAPEEAVHFLEYGLLGYFLFRAFRHSVSDPGIYLLAFLAGSLFGTFDEIIQWILPQRFWDFRDVGLNALSSGLFQLALWKVVRPSLPSSRPSLRTVKKIMRLGASLVTLLCLCALNTPARVKSLTEIFPSLSFLLKEEPMYEFTHKHKDPEIGVWFSRLRTNELLSKDAATAADNGRILAEWKDKDYGLFLRNFLPFLHIVPYEFRVHVFRRDRMLETGRKSADEGKRKTCLLAAWKENRILEKYFPKTLTLSPYVWEADTAQAVRGEIDPSVPYRSPVSAGSVITVSEPLVWTIMLLSWLACGAVSFFAGKKAKPARGIEPRT